MKKLILLTASILAMSCSPVAGETSAAHDQNSNMHTASSKLFVSATGHAAQAPDQASVSAGVVTEAPDASSAMAENARKMNAAFAALKAAGIKERNIMTSQMSLSPKYNYQNRQSPRITGYEARNTVSAKTDNLDKVGAMLDALVKAGVNNINGVTFSIKDGKAAKDKARMDAIAEARAKAEGMAKAAGVRLGKVLEIREGSAGGYNPQPQPMMMRSMSADAAPTPVSGGEQTLSVTVSITYALEQ